VDGLALLAIVAGASFVLQSRVNAKRRAALDAPNWAALMALVTLLARDPLPAVAVAQRAP